eukprot:3891344-Amphidinium_carterae.1
MFNPKRTQPKSSTVGGSLTKETTSYGRVLGEPLQACSRICTGISILSTAQGTRFLPRVRTVY